MKDNKYYTEEAYEKNGKYAIHPLNGTGLETYFQMNSNQSYNSKFLRNCKYPELYKEAMAEIEAEQKKKLNENDERKKIMDLYKNSDKVNNQNPDVFNKQIEEKNKEHLMSVKNEIKNNNNKIINNKNNLIKQQQQQMNNNGPIIVNNNKEKGNLKKYPNPKQFNI
jgi:predicted nucleic-acid-binding Zn-ribbon protein